MFEMIRLIFCRMPLQNSVMLKLKTKNRNHIKLFLHHWSEKKYNIQIQIFLKYHLQKFTLLSLQELKSQDIVSISTLSALIKLMALKKLEIILEVWSLNFPYDILIDQTCLPLKIVSKLLVMVNDIIMVVHNNRRWRLPVNRELCFLFCFAAHITCHLTFGNGWL